MPDLNEDSRNKLDGIVLQMTKNGESEDSISAVVSDFKSKYANGSSPAPAKSPTSDALPTSRGFGKRVVETGIGMAKGFGRSVYDAGHLLAPPGSYDPEPSALQPKTTSEEAGGLGEAGLELAAGGKGVYNMGRELLSSQRAVRAAEQTAEAVSKTLPKLHPLAKFLINRVPGGKTATSIYEWAASKYGPELAGIPKETKEELIRQLYKENHGKLPESAGEKADSVREWGDRIKSAPAKTQQGFSDNSTLSPKARGPIPPPAGGPVQSGTIPTPPPEPLPGTLNPGARGAVPRTTGPVQSGTIPTPPPQKPAPIGTRGPEALVPAKPIDSPTPTKTFVSSGSTTPEPKKAPSKAPTFKNAESEEPEHQVVSKVSTHISDKASNIARHLKDMGIKPDEFLAKYNKAVKDKDWVEMNSLVAKAYASGKNMGAAVPKSPYRNIGSLDTVNDIYDQLVQAWQATPELRQKGWYP